MTNRIIKQPHKKHQPPVDRTCEQCGKPFTAWAAFVDRGKAKFCSLPCFHASRKKRIKCTCEQCGIEFETPLSGIQIYCSKQCYSLSQVNQVECVCRQCGSTFKVPPNYIERGLGKYCSVQCTSASRRTKIRKTCLQCGSEFETYLSDNKNRGKNHCSSKCAGLAKRNQIDKTCEICGCIFQARKCEVERGRERFCSIQCRSTGQRSIGNPNWTGGTVDYRGANWLQQRDMAYTRDQGICQHCGKKNRKGQRKFAVHHIKPFRDFNGDYSAANELTNLITLCHQCHPAAEHGKIIIQPYLL